MILGIGQVIRNADTICNRQCIRQIETERRGKRKGKEIGRWMYGRRKGVKEGCPLTLSGGRNRDYRHVVYTASPSSFR